MADFAELNAQVVGISVDHIPCLQAWAKELGGISYPLVSDFWPHGATAQRYGILRDEGYSERAVFLIDKEGVVRYADVHDIEDQPDNETVLVELRRLEPDASAGAAERAGEVTAESETKVDTRTRVTMYCTKWCPDCRKARAWLQEHNIGYVEVDVSAAPEAAEKVKGWTGGKLITPTCDIEGTIVVDFDEARYRELLGV